METKYYEELFEKFIKIANMGYVKGINNFTGGAGLTFEKLLGKEVDNMFFPDYYGIEIKTSLRYSHFPLTLFSLAFDGPNFFEMNALQEKYGVVDYQFKDKKVLYCNLVVNTYVKVSDKYFFKLFLDYKKQRIAINIYDLKYKLLEEASYINFETLKQRVEIKLNKLAFIWASKKVIYSIHFFRYYKIIFYTLKNFDTFLKLLEKGIIFTEISTCITRSGAYSGKQRNKNMIFKIRKENLELLFDKDKEYDNDKQSNY